jgi:hypothetical protein
VVTAQAYQLLLEAIAKMNPAIDRFEVQSQTLCDFSAQQGFGNQGS